MEGFEKLWEHMQACVRCDACLTYCPLTRVLGFERSPLITVLFTGFSSRWDLPMLQDLIFHSTLCGACEVVCPRQIPISQTVEWVRRKFVDKCFPLPLRYLELLEAVRAEGNPFKELRAKRQEAYRRRHDKPSSLLFYPGCVTLYREPDLVRAFEMIMEKAGVAFQTLPKEETCCGSVLLKTGFEGEAERLANLNLQLFRQKNVKVIVTNCPGCHRMFKKYLNSETDFEILHVSQYFLRLLEAGKLRPKAFEGEVTITYHDPCDLGRRAGIYEEPRRIIASVPNVNLVEMAYNRERAICCGAGGGVGALNRSLALKMSKLIVEQAEMVKAQILVTGCPLCKRFIKEAIKDQEQLNVMELTEFVVRLL
ncbi:TPA: (Fe-S)-binding protein [Candidatus Bathyarchaeota archaeon]|nr:(Fe-S)-binding protein [Candidatus Bathyarchaeota archaeon]